MLTDSSWETALLQNFLTLLSATPKNEIRFFSGIRRKTIDALIGGGIVVRHFPYFLASANRILTHRDSSALNIFKNNKVVYFNGTVFVDCFSPKWPGKIFDRVTDTLIENYQREIDHWQPFTVALVFSITKKCVYRCEHCYAAQTLSNRETMSFDQLLKIAKEFQKLGVGIIAWEGGEPTIRFNDLVRLIEETHQESEAWLATTAYGLNQKKAQRLKEAGLTAAIISLDHYDPDKHNRFRRNKKAFDMAVNGVQLFRENGILPSICICATRDILRKDGLFRYLELAKEIGVAFVQILDATPIGNYIDKDVMLSNAQLEEIKRFHSKINTDPAYKDYPAISARALLESDDYYGCCAGNGLCYVDNSGYLQACDFLQIAFGNVLEEGVETVYKRMKKYFPHPYSGRCPAQTLHKEIAEAFHKNSTLPLPYEDCLPILNKISKRGLPSRAFPRNR